MYFIEGLANGRIAVLGKIHHALADGVASANLLARGWTCRRARDRDSYATDPAPSEGELVRSALRDHVRLIRRLPGEVRYTAQGVQRVRRSSRKLSPELTRPFTPPPTFMNHKVDPVRRFATATLALADIKQTGISVSRSTTWCWSISRQVSVPSSSTRPGRSGQRCAVAANPDVMPMFSRCIAAAIRRYLSGGIGASTRARLIVATMPSVSVSRAVAMGLSQAQGACAPRPVRRGPVA
jgi:hypothetical protein